MVNRVVLIDEVLPTFDVNEVHSRHVRASAEATMNAARSVTAREVRSLAPLWAIRAMPVLLTGRRVFRFDHGAPLLESAERAGFLPLLERPDAMVIGNIGQYWRPRGGERPPFGDLDGFRDFDHPGFVKAAVDFRIVPDGDGVRLTTETRVSATDTEARTRMRRYWRLIRPGSGLIRRGWLRAAKRRAEP